MRITNARLVAALGVALVATACTTDKSLTTFDGGPAGNCDAGGALCSGRCVDLQSDPAHCGRCGEVCPSGGSCEQGVCVCSPGLVNCGQLCADLSTHLQHCGECGQACALGAQCSSGNCVCPGGFTDCGDVCADLQRDPMNCGNCGDDCGPLASGCSDGDCVCGPGSERCSGECADTARDAQNCGGCGVRCDPGEICQAGGCVCGPGLTDCGAGCVDPIYDGEHCGGCGIACNPGTEFCGQGSCVATACDQQVPAALACGPQGQACVPLAAMQNHPLHCGSCDNVCAVEEVCAGGECRDYRPGRACSACPCADCDADRCCEYPAPGQIICVDSDLSCP